MVLQFNPGAPLTDTDPGYNSNPSAGDKVHVVVCVISANASEIKGSVLQKMNEVRDAARELGKNRTRNHRDAPFIQDMVVLQGLSLGHWTFLGSGGSGGTFKDRTIKETRQ